jgi:uncharacterized membrane protein
MDLTFLFPWVLFLHVLGAILAFGPTFAFSIIGGMGGKEPQHANFATRVSARITDRLVEPLAILQGVTGVILILLAGLPLFRMPWLLVAIVIYVIAVAFALGVQRKRVHRIIELTSAPPPPDAGGPPPELLATIKQVQRGGMFLGIAVIVIVFLMVMKPGGVLA